MNRRKTGTMADDMMRLAMAAPLVVAQRTMRMALAGPTPSARDRKEMNRMSAEKIEAFTESWNNTATRMARANMAFGFELMQAAWAPWDLRGKRVNAAAARLGDAATASIEGSLGPVRRRAVSNAKRLARKRSA